MTDQLEPDGAREATSAEAEASRSSAPTPKPARKKRRFPLSAVEVLSFALAVNVIATVGLGVRVYRGDKPTVMTVGITQMTREYMAKLATNSAISPQEASIRTRLYLAVAQDAVRTAATRKGVLVVPRECVLAGEYADLTGDVAKAVNATMAEKARGLSASSVAAPAELGPQAMLEGEGHAVR